MIYTIKRVQSCGKWIEFWFKESDSERFDRCCKYYLLQKLVDGAKLDQYVLNHGFVGLKLDWDGDGPIKVLPADPGRF